MTVEEVYQFCMSLPLVTEDMPFGDDVVTFRIQNKIFCALMLNNDEPRIALKCDPEKAADLREHYSAVEPAWHWNKIHWNDIYLSRDMRTNEIQFWIEHAYNLVNKKQKR